MSKYCKVCHAPSGSLDEKGRCPFCRDAATATARGMSYGQYIAAKPPALREYFQPVPLRELPVMEKVKHCRVCGAIIPPESPRRTLCSPECWETYNRTSAREAHERKKAQSGPIPERFCAVCGKPFYSPFWQQKTCSDGCSKAFKAAYRRERKKNAPKKEIEG